MRLVTVAIIFFVVLFGWKFYIEIRRALRGDVEEPPRMKGGKPPKIGKLEVY